VYNLEVPADSRIVIEVKALDVDCPYDFVQFSADISPNVLRLCPVSTVPPGDNF
jgi:hypothetical protein